MMTNIAILHRFYFANLGICLLAATGAQAGGGADVIWTDRTPLPSTRGDHAMVYDSVRDVFVLFGGAGTGGALSGETWEHQDHLWVLKAITGPTPRSKHAMAFDEGRGVVVLFGGDDAAPGLLRDTWEWNGTQWTKQEVPGPSARIEHTLAYDAARGVIVLYGGARANGTLNDETWVYQAGVWTSKTPKDSPGPRYLHAMSYDRSRQKTALFGGFSGGELNDTWEWDGTNWSRLPEGATSPSPRTLHAMAYDESRGVTVLFGGYDASTISISGETWEWDGATWELRSSGGAVPRRQHTMTYGGGSRGVILFGGYDSYDAPLNDTWKWDGTTWTLIVAQTGPSPRAIHAMDYDNRRAVVVLFGGFAGGTSALGDTWEWNGTTWNSWGAAGPSARFDHAMAYDSRRRKMVLFGGRTATASPSGETWERDGTVWSPAQPGPPARYNHAMAYDAARGVTVLFGGSVSTFQPLGDTWEWNGATWQLRASAGPTPRAGHAMTYDSLHGRVLLFGGNDGALNGETWEWDGDRYMWTQQSATGPSPRSGHALCFDAIRGKAVLFGGQVSPTAQLDGQTWEWDGADWTLTAESGPSPRYVHAMAYDAARGRAVLFGGSDGLLDRRTWEYTPDCNANGVADTDDILLGTSTDCDANRIPDECQEDCNANGTADVCDLAAGTSADCDSNGIPDECEPDCNGNELTDACDLAGGFSLDCNSNAVPDECEPDCNSNGIADACDLAAGASLDCNANASPDECDVAGGGSADCNADGLPDECDLTGMVDSRWAGGAGAWSHAARWCPPQVPDNSIDAAYRVTVANPTSQVTLDVSPTLDALVVDDGATIAINAASGAAVRTLAVGSPIQNDGTLLATDGRRLLLDASDIQQGALGVIAAIGAPGEASKLQINGRRVTGGVARTSGDAAAIELLGGAVLEDVRIEGNTESASSATVVVPDQQSGTIAGTIQNQGRIEVHAATNPTTLKPGAEGAILSGDGVLTLRSPSPAPLAELGADSRTMTNSAGHRIEGAGTILGLFVNDGAIDANTPGGRIVLSENGRKSMGPSGTCRASMGGTLEIRKRINHFPEDEPLGTLAAVGGTIQLRHPKGDSVVVRCAAAEASSNGAIELSDAARLELTGALTLASGGTCGGINPAAGELTAGSARVFGEGSRLLLTETMAARMSGELTIGDDGGCRDGRRGCIQPLVGMTGSSSLETGSLAISGGGVLEMGDTASASVSGAITLESGGIYRAGPTSSAASMTAGSVSILGGNEAGQLLLSDQMTLEVSGDLTLNAPGGGCRDQAEERGCIKPLLLVSDFGQANVGGAFRVQDAADLSIGPSVAFSVTGDFENRSTDSLAFDWASGPLILDGANQTFEAAGDDMGPDAVGLLNNFAIGELTLAPGTAVNVVDAFDNQQDGQVACDEAVYVNSLIVNTGAVLSTAGCRIYFTTLVNHGSIPGLGTTVMGMSGPDSDGDGVPDGADACPGHNDFADCDGDGVPDGCDSEPDCNANGVPDVCESAAPCAHIVGAASWRTHGGGVGRDMIPIDPAGRVGAGGVTSEPRIGGLIELRIAFDTAPGGPGPAPVSVEQLACGDGGFAPYSGDSTATGSIEGNELVLAFAPALQNARTYRFTLGPQVSAVPGQSIQVRSLAGDVNSNGRVNGNDRSTVVALWTGPGYSPQTDVTLDGRTSGADRSVVIGYWTSPENCAP